MSIRYPSSNRILSSNRRTSSIQQFTASNNFMIGAPLAGGGPSSRIDNSKKSSFLAREQQAMH